MSCKHVCFSALKISLFLFNLLLIFVYFSLVFNSGHTLTILLSLVFSLITTMAVIVIFLKRLKILKIFSIILLILGGCFFTAGMILGYYTIIVNSQVVDDALAFEIMMIISGMITLVGVNLVLNFANVLSKFFKLKESTSELVRDSLEESLRGRAKDKENLNEA